MASQGRPRPELSQLTDEEMTECWKVAGVAGITAIPTVAYFVTTAGFGDGGVVAGSVAAAVQSQIGNIAGGGMFAFLQSVGAAGMSAAGKVAVGGVASGTAYYMCQKYHGKI